VWWPGLPATVTEYVQTCPTWQRVKADHLPPAGLRLLFPLLVPSRTGRGGCVSLDFLARELPTAVSARGHDFKFLHVHIRVDLLAGRVWLVPTFKTATADSEVAARNLNFVGSVFRDVGPPDTLVSDRDTRFTSSFSVWTALHAGVALGASLIFGSPHHHNTTSKEITI
jgi:hypothetical protein